MTARRLLAALLMALVGSAIFTFWVSKKLARPAPAAAPQQQYVASINNLQAGDTLQKVNLSLVDWPTSKPLTGAFIKLDELVGRTVLFPLSAGEPILERHLSVAGSGNGLATKIPDGMRAISLKSDQIVGVAGFLLPGTHVDVLVTYRTQGAQESAVTSTVLQDAEIIAAGQKMQPDPEGKPTTVDVVTLLVSPDDAERVVLGSSQGVVHFVLRNGSDHVHVTDHMAQISQFGAAPLNPMVAHKAATIVTAAPQPKAYVVHTMAGDKQSAESFQ